MQDCFEKMEKKDYEQLRKKHKLPTFEVLDREFEIEDIEEKTHLLNKIRDKILDRIEFLIKIIDRHLHPEIDSFAHAYECNCFSDKEKEELVKIYQELMKYHRSFLMADVGTDEKLTASIINNLIKNWDKLKKSLLSFVKKLREHWEKIEETQELLRYLG